MTQYRLTDDGDVLDEEEIQSYFVSDTASLPEDVSFDEWLDEMIGWGRIEVIEDEDV